MTLLSKTCCFLSVILLFSVGWQTFYQLTPPQYWLLNFLDSTICIFYLADWIDKLRKAGSRKQFLKWGWVDLLCSIPFSQAVWVQYYAVLRLVLAFRAVKYIHDL